MLRAELKSHCVWVSGSLCWALLSICLSTLLGRSSRGMFICWLGHSFIHKHSALYQPGSVPELSWCEEGQRGALLAEGTALRKALSGEEGWLAEQQHSSLLHHFLPFQTWANVTPQTLSFHICKIGTVVRVLKIVVLVLKILYFYRTLKGLYLNTSSLSYSFPPSILSDAFNSFSFLLVIFLNRWYILLLSLLTLLC